MKINKDNYEAFFLDFVEGRLDDSSMLEMLAFLRNNPHLKEELESFADIKIPIQEEIFTDKDYLTKFDFTNTAINPGNFDDYCIAYHEKILSSAETKRLLNYLDKHPEKKTNFYLFGKTILKADPAVLFMGKSQLLRKTRSRILYPVILRWTAVAAGIALLVSVFYLNDSKNMPLQTVERNVITKERIAAPAVNKQAIKDQSSSNKIASANNYTSQVPPQEQTISTDVVTKDSGNAVQIVDMIEPILIEEIPVTSQPMALVSLENNVEFRDNEKEAETVENSAWDEDEDRLVKKVFKKTGLLPKKKITLWDIAQATIKGYNSISEKDIKLSKETNDNGKLTAIALETENRKYGFKTKN